MPAYGINAESPLFLVSTEVFSSPAGEASETELQAVDSAKAQIDGFRTNPQRAMLGAEQVDFVTSAVKSSVAAGVQWQLVHSNSLLQDVVYDYLAAAKAASSEQAKLWSDALANYTSDATNAAGTAPAKSLYSYSSACYRRGQEAVPVKYDLSSDTSYTAWQYTYGFGRGLVAAGQQK